MKKLPLGVVLCALLLLSAEAQRSYFVAVRITRIGLTDKKGTNRCVIVGDDAQYRFEAWPGTDEPTKKNTRVYQGRVSDDLYKKLQALVNSPQLAGLASTSQLFHASANDPVKAIVVLVRRGRDTQNLAYQVAGGEGFIPPGVKAFEPWMKDFEAQLGTPLKGEEPRQCSYLDAPPGFQPKLEKR